MHGPTVVAALAGTEPRCLSVCRSRLWRRFLFCLCWRRLTFVVKLCPTLFDAWRRVHGRLTSNAVAPSCLIWFLPSHPLNATLSPVRRTTTAYWATT
eukprot:6174519-Pleurochrysis_carterae.AAC.1